MFQYYIKFVCSILILLTNSSFSFGQSNSDYFISLDNDTLYGEVTLSTNYSKRFLFKPLDNNKTVTYKASEIKGFSDDGHIYHSLKLDGSPTYEIRQLLVDGHIKLYERKNSKELISFIISKNNQLALLEQTIVIESNRAVRNPRYLRTLKEALEDQPLIVQKVDKVEFDKKGMSNLIYDYNLSKNGNSVDYSKAKHKINVTSTIEFSLSSKGLKSDFEVFRIQDEASDPNFGFGYIIGFKNRKGQEVGLGVELYRHSSAFSREFSLGTELFEFNNFLLSIPARINFKFGDGLVRPIIFGEFVYMTLLNKNYEYLVTSPAIDIIIDESRRLPSSKSIGFRFGAGITINSHFQLLFKYSSFGFMSNNDILNLDLTPYSLSIGYIL